MNFWLCRERAALHIWRWSPCQVRPWPWMLLKPVLPPEIKEIQQVYCHSGESIRVHVHQVHQGFGIMWGSSGVHVHVKVIRDTYSSCEGHQGYMFIGNLLGVHVKVIRWKFIHIFIGSSSDVKDVLKYIRYTVNLLLFVYKKFSQGSPEPCHCEYFSPQASYWHMVV